MKRKMLQVLLMFIVVGLVFGCATGANDISGTYVSPLIYQNYSCEQLQQEMIRVNNKIMDLTGQQDKKASGDAWAFGIGMLLFWPALFFMVGDDKKEELARLKGELEAIEKMAIQKGCGSN